MDEQQTLLVMAALIAAVRTARFEQREFQGAASPRMMGEIANALWLAERICKRAVDLNVGQQIPPR